ncbi:cytochrome c3 family protein [Geomonas sp.]|uniref:cytochrome c3 family protein n=1 Tax=Geomonas sp. TaxID=2651584 RepID=UPI002B484C7E|nr:cytochrome c3 family protein [Geomonas sp.]
MGDLTLPFTHWAHQKLTDNNCTSCHPSGIGKIENWGKEAAHALCVSCHQRREKGPVQCEECHKVSVSRGLRETVPTPR